MKTGMANLPLHPGRAPRWLFGRMVRLSGEITRVVVDEYGQEEFLRRLSDPFWFQAFGCVLGFDWHSSGLTTTVTGALKEGVNPEETGIAICGGKGKASRKAPKQIEENGETFSLTDKKISGLVYSSRMSAKVDNAALQDGYQLYHHVFVFTEKGNWCVIQQGMNSGNGYARRYHWLSGFESFVNGPHSAICCDEKSGNVLDMTAKESEEARKSSVDIVNDGARRYFGMQRSLSDFMGPKIKYLHMPRTHFIPRMNKRNIQTLQQAYEIQPKNYEELLGIEGIGPKTVRALSLVSDLVYGAKASWSDPVKFSFSHGGKDGIPYPVDREAMNRSIEILRSGVEEAGIGNAEKLKAVRRLQGFIKT